MRRRRGGNELRVAHILPWPTIGGVEHGALRLATAAKRFGIDSVALCLPSAAPVRELFTGSGFETGVYDAVEPSIRHPSEHLRASRRLAAELRSRSIDLVHCADLLGSYHAGLAGRLAGIPVITHVRCAYPSISWRDRLFLRSTRHWIFVSEATRREFAVAVPDSRATVLYDAVPTTTLADDRGTVASAVKAEFGLAGDARLIGMIARVAPIKDYETLARAAVHVIRQEPRSHFVVIGDTSGAESYRDHFATVKGMLAELGVGEHFTFTGFRPDVSRLAQAMEIITLVTHSEGLPLVLLEAMGLGKPVVATAVGGVPELVNDGTTGLLHAHGDPLQLADALLALLSDGELAQQLGGAGREFVNDRFGEARYTAEVAAVYSAVAGVPVSPIDGEIERAAAPLAPLKLTAASAGSSPFQQRP